MSVQLEPCPFCGGEAETGVYYVGDPDENTAKAYVECRECGAEMMHFDSVAEAAEAWNRQASLRWVPVEEALPERREKVLICGLDFDGAPGFGVGWYIGEPRRGWDRAGGFIETVTHWARIRMPDCEAIGDRR